MLVGADWRLGHCASPNRGGRQAPFRRPPCPCVESPRGLLVPKPAIGYVWCQPILEATQDACSAVSTHLLLATPRAWSVGAPIPSSATSSSGSGMNRLVPPQATGRSI